MELARLAAPPDQHYGLPVVVCPRCTVASVRRPYAGGARWRTFLRTLATARHMLFGVSMFGLLVLLGVVCCGVISEGVSDAFYRQPPGAIFSPNDIVRERLHNWWMDIGFVVVPAWLVLWPVLGLLGGAWFPHWRVQRYLAGMVSLAVLPFVVSAVAVGLSRWVEDGTPPIRAAVGGLRDLYGPAGFAVSLLGGLLLSSLAMPIGLRTGRRLTADRGLRSRRLGRARKKRNRDT